MNAIRSLLRCNAGAAVIEFAVLAPLFFMMLFGVIEFSRFAWTRQTLEQVAYSTARCMSVSAACNTTAKQKSYAVAQSVGFGIKIVAADVTATGNTTCKGYASSNSVVIQANFSSPIEGFMGNITNRLAAKACFPVLA